MGPAKRPTRSGASFVTIMALGCATLAACEWLVDVDGLTGADGGLLDGALLGDGAKIDGAGDGGVGDGQGGQDSSPAEVGATNVSIDCRGSKACTSPSCCLPTDGGSGTCESPCPSSSIVINCDDRTDCPSTGPRFCCGTTVAGLLVSASCTSSCAAKGDVPLCSLSGSGPGAECPEGGTCQSANIFIPYPHCP